MEKLTDVYKAFQCLYIYRAMLGSDELQKYDRARVFLDEDYTAADKFTVSILFNSHVQKYYEKNYCTCFDLYTGIL